MTNCSGKRAAVKLIVSVTASEVPCTPGPRILVTWVFTTRAFRNNQQWLGGALFSKMYWASKQISIFWPPAARCQLKCTYLTVSLLQPLEEWSFRARSQAGFILTFSYADVPCAAAGLPAEWEWGRRAAPASLTFQEAASCLSSPLPGAAWPISSSGRRAGQKGV